jgi:hypothetical protein
MYIILVYNMAGAPAHPSSNRIGAKVCSLCGALMILRTAAERRTCGNTVQATRLKEEKIMKNILR